MAIIRNIKAIQEASGANRKSMVRKDPSFRGYVGLAIPFHCPETSREFPVMLSFRPLAGAHVKTIPDDPLRAANARGYNAFFTYLREISNTLPKGKPLNLNSLLGPSIRPYIYSTPLEEAGVKPSSKDSALDSAAADVCDYNYKKDPTFCGFVGLCVPYTDPVTKWNINIFINSTPLCASNRKNVVGKSAKNTVAERGYNTIISSLMEVSTRLTVKRRPVHLRALCGVDFRPYLMPLEPNNS